MMKHVRLALVCALGLMGASAMAASSASASLSNLTFQLVDMTPDDANTPFYNLQAGLGYTALSTTANGGLNNPQSLNEQKNELLWPQSLSSAQGAANASVYSFADGMSASGSASGAFNGFNGSVSGQSYDPATSAGTAGIQLSPHSMLIVSITASASSWAGGAQCSALYNYACPVMEYSRASAYMSLSSYATSPSGAVQSYGYRGEVLANAAAACACYKYVYDPELNTYRNVLQDAVDQSTTDNRTLTAVFVNDSDVVRTATLQLGVGVSGASMTAVPEPATLAMQSLGLLAVGGVALARRKRLA